MNTFLFIAILLLIFYKISIFLLLCIPLRIFNKKNIHPNNISTKVKKTSTLPNEEYTTANKPSKSFFKKLKTFIWLIFDGYNRYLGYWIGYFPSQFIRNAVYKHVFFMNIQEGVTIRYGLKLLGMSGISIDKGSALGDECWLDGRFGIKIGKNVNIASQVHMWSASYDMNDPYFRSNPKTVGPIIIDDNAWIGPHTTILDNVHIGEGAVICAGAVVTKDVEPFTVVAGIPAKKIKERNRDIRYKLEGSSFFY